jgi:hypothetical protein
MKLYWFAKYNLSTGEQERRASWLAKSLKEACEYVLCYLHIKDKSWKVGPSGRVFVRPGGDETWVFEKEEEIQNAD